VRSSRLAAPVISSTASGCPSHHSFGRLAATGSWPPGETALLCNTSRAAGQSSVVAPQSSSKRVFESVFDAHSADVAAYLRRRVSPQVADDVLADTFLVAWRRVGEMPARPLPWLLGIARKTLANHLRGRRRHAALVDRLRLRASAGSPREQAAEEADGSDVLEALRRLKPIDQEVLMLIAWEELTAAEAAAVLGCSLGAFRVRLHRARNRMKRQLRRKRGRAAVHSVIEEAR
jgi:RNA polymerase sigma-70 factor, ECF subfamily